MGIRGIIKDLSYRALDKGWRLPAPADLRNYAQLGRTIDLIRAQGVSLVLDVGANRGWYAYHLRRAGFRGRIISFEPIDREFDSIERLAASDDAWSAQNVALGEEDAERIFNLIVADGADGQTVLSSFLQPQGALGYRTEQVPVSMRRLDSLLPVLVPDLDRHRIFLKMDTQGYDLAVLSGTGHIMNHVVLLQSELSVLPLYEDMPSYTQALARYHEAGLVLADLFVVNRTVAGDVLEYDCLMRRAS